MTLIMNLVSPGFVVQVSDRRVTLPDGRVVDDDTIKSVILLNQMVFSFTGMAAIGPQKTALWLAEELASQLTITSTTEDACRYIAYRAAAACRNLPLPVVDKRLAFVGVGYTGYAGDGSLINASCVISNFHDNEERELPRAKDDFTCYWTRGGIEKGHKGHWFAKPEWLTRSEADGLHRLMKRIMSRTQTQVPYVTVFKDMIRRVSARLEAAGGTNAHRVGKSLLITVIPKPIDDSFNFALQMPNGLVYGCLEDGTVKLRTESTIITRFSPDGATGDFSYMPHVVFPGLIMANIWTKTGTMTPEEVKEVMKKSRPGP